jgi:rubrerythrin
MEFKSIPEILRFAIGKEKASRQFYYDVAARVTDPITQSVFEAIGLEEQKHIDALELELMKLGITVDVDAEFDENEKRWLKTVEMDEDAENMDFREAMLIAIQKEKASHQLYIQILGLIQQPEYRDIFRQLAEEEMRHIVQFEREYQAMS